MGIIILCGLSIAAELPFASNQNVGTQLLGMLGAGGYLFALVFSLVFAWIERKRLRLLAVIPLLLCFGSCVATTTVGRSMRRAEFERQFPRYVALVERIRSVEALASNKVESISLSEAERALVYNVLGELDTNGVLTVELLTGGGFPLKHSGYLYTSSGSVEPGSFFDERWPFKTEVKTNWYRISD
ncbi:MAG TPA: hypothetical protein VI136_03280 [Verrucomicrobiae bacterium]